MTTSLHDKYTINLGMYVVLVYVLDIKTHMMVKGTNMNYVVCSSNKKQLLDCILDLGLHATSV